MPSEDLEPESGRTSATLAPPWHTFALVALILTVALAGSLLGLAHSGGGGQAAQNTPPVSRIFLQYLPLIVVNLGLVVYTTQLFRSGNALPALLGKGWSSPRRAVLDLALAVGCGALICVLEFSYQQSFGVGHNAAVAKMLPSTEAERLTWLFVAGSVGFCEELVYRGYLQIQLSAFSGSAAVGIVLQAVLFGIAHLEQGLAPACRAAGYGLALGVLARVRRSLLPGILCHVGIDLASSLFP